MTILRILRARRIAREAGTTLIELMVVLMLLAIVLPVAYTSVNAVQRQVSITSNRFQALSEAQVILDRITKDLRTAVFPATNTPPFSIATINEIKFYASLADPNGPTLLHAYISPIFAGSPVNAFHEDSTAVTPLSSPWTWNPANTKSRLDGEFVDTTVATIFTYYGVDGSVLPMTVVTLPAVPAVVEPADIDSIGITLTTRITPTAPASTITTLVHIRNVDYNPNGGG